MSLRSNRICVSYRQFTGLLFSKESDCFVSQLVALSCEKASIARDCRSSVAKAVRLEDFWSFDVAAMWLDHNGASPSCCIVALSNSWKQSLLGQRAAVENETRSNWPYLGGIALMNLPTSRRDPCHQLSWKMGR